MNDRIHLLWFVVVFVIGYFISELIWQWEWIHTPPYRRSFVEMWWIWRVLAPSVPAMVITIFIMAVCKRIFGFGGGAQTYYAPPQGQGQWGPN
jgi:hypothetical protein